MHLFHFSLCTESFDQVSSNLRPAGMLSKLFSSTKCTGATHAVEDWDTFLKKTGFPIRFINLYEMAILKTKSGVETEKEKLLNTEGAHLMKGGRTRVHAHKFRPDVKKKEKGTFS